MKMLMRWLAVMAAALLVPAVANAADDPFLGTWSLNREKSTLPPGYDVKSKIFVVAPTADGILATETVTSFSQSGENAVYKIPYVYGGKFTPQNATALYDGLSVRLAGGNMALLTFQLKGETVSQALQTVSDDGKTMTQQILWTKADPSNQITNFKFVFDKQ